MTEAREIICPHCDREIHLYLYGIEVKVNSAWHPKTVEKESIS